MDNQKDVVLLMPPVVEGFVMANPSMGLAYLAAILEPTYTVNVFDYNIDKNFDPYNVIEDILETHKPKVIGLSLTTLNVPQAEEIIEVIRKHKDRPVLIAGGPHATALPAETLQTGYDYIVIGEGETTLLELVDFIFGRSSFKSIDEIDGIAFIRDEEVVITGKRQITDMKTLPLPAWHYFDLEKYSSVAVKRKRCMPVMASRGCPDRCTFCFKGVFGTNLRVREPESLVNEIQFLKDTYGIDEFVFLDENITTKKQFVLDFCRLLTEREINLPWFMGSGVRVDRVDDEIVKTMREAGCYRTCLGVESGNEDILRDMRKKTTKDQIRKAVELFKKYKYEITLYFMIGMPNDTRQTIQDSIDFAKELNTDLAQFPVLTPFPGTELYDYFKAENLLTGTNWGDYNTFIPNSNPTFKHPNLSWEELLELKRKAYRDFYFRPGYAFGQLKSIRSFSDVKHLFKKIVTFLGFLKSSTFTKRKAKSDDKKKDNIDVQTCGNVNYDSLLKNEKLYQNREKYYIQKLCNVIDDTIKRTGRSDLSILELGFNDGNRLRELSAIYKDIKFVGLEIREEPVLNMQAQGYDCRLSRSELLNEEFGTGEKFDIIYGIAVLHHLYDPYKSLESIIGLLKPSGALLFAREAHPYDLVSHLHTTIARTWPYEKNLFKMKRRRFKKTLSQYTPDYKVKYDNNGVTPCFRRFNKVYCMLGLHRVPLWNGMSIYAKVVDDT